MWMIGAFGTPPVSPRFNAAKTELVGWISIVFFGLCAIVGGRRFLNGGEQLRINRSGISWAQWSDVTIPWTEITKVSTWSYGRQQIIVLHLRNPSRYPGRGTLRLTRSMNRAMTGGDISLSLAGTDRSYWDAMAAIEQFRPGEGGL